MHQFTKRATIAMAAAAITALLMAPSAEACADRAPASHSKASSIECKRAMQFARSLIDGDSTKIAPESTPRECVDEPAAAATRDNTAKTPDESASRKAVATSPAY